MNNLFFNKNDNILDSKSRSNSIRKETSNEFSNTNQSLKLDKRKIKDKFELDEIKRRLEEISNIREKHGNLWYSKDEYTELFAVLQTGIVIDTIPYRDEIINNLISFFDKYGISKEEIISKISELEFFVSDIDLAYSGKLVQTCDRIGIDISYAKFSEDGKFVGFREELKDFLTHTVTHEILHKLSEMQDGKKIFFRYQDALSEGYTDMFAHLISGKRNIRSDLYEFPEKVCELFTEMIGMDKTVDDYLYHNQDFSNLQKVFLECECKDFSLFRSIFDKIIKRVNDDKKAGKTGCLALEEKDACLAFIRDNILFPYCHKNPDRAVQVLNKFNSLFSVLGYEFSIDDVKSKFMTI